MSENGLEKPAKRRTEGTLREDERSRSGGTRKRVIAARAKPRRAPRARLRARAVALEDRDSSRARSEQRGARRVSASRDGLSRALKGHFTMCAEAAEGGRTGSPRVSDAGRTRGGDTRAWRLPRPHLVSLSPLRDARRATPRFVCRRRLCGRGAPGKRLEGRARMWKMTLPELYLAYIADTGEELRDALLRVAGEPRSNPNRRNVHELLAEHLGDVAAVTADRRDASARRFFTFTFSRRPRSASRRRRVRRFLADAGNSSCIRAENPYGRTGKRASRFRASDGENAVVPRA